MEWLTEFIAHCVADYGVDPTIFVGLYLAKSVVYYYALYKVVRAIIRKQWGRLPSLITLAIGVNLIPFVYVYAFGHNLPWWFHALFLCVISYTTVLLGWEIKRRLRRPAA